MDISHIKIWRATTHFLDDLEEKNRKYFDCEELSNEQTIFLCGLGCIWMEDIRLQFFDMIGWVLEEEREFFFSTLFFIFA